MTSSQNQRAPSAEALKIDHEFKAAPTVFYQTRDGLKTFEFRKDDRPGGFHVGQTISLRCYRPSDGYTDDPPVIRRITNILRPGEFGLQEGYCILSLAAAPAPPAGDMRSDLIARLTRLSKDGWTGSVEKWCSEAIFAMSAAIAALNPSHSPESGVAPSPEGRGEICALSEALKPFAALADEIEQMAARTGIPVEGWAKSCAWNDLVRAREAYAGLNTGGGVAEPPSLTNDDVRAARIRECMARAKEFWAGLDALDAAKSAGVQMLNDDAVRAAEPETPALTIESITDWLKQNGQDFTWPNQPETPALTEKKTQRLVANLHRAGREADRQNLKWTASIIREAIDALRVLPVRQEGERS